MADLPPFPTDDATLIALEHALDAALDVDESGTHRVVGADYTVPQLLDFLGGATSAPAVDARPGDVFIDDRDHYTRDDVIRALVTEVRRLRAVQATAKGDEA